MQVTGIKLMVLGTILVLLTGCAATPVQAPQIQRISPEELERIMPKPVPNLTLEEITHLSKQGTTAEQIIEKIKASNSRYDLTPSQSLELSKQGVDAKVLDYIYAAYEQTLREVFADEINQREKENELELEKLRRDYQWRYQQYYDPFWGYGYYGYSPYWRYRYRPFYGPGYGW
jgi:valyl-tRNA synthetase